MPADADALVEALSIDEAFSGSAGPAARPRHDPGHGWLARLCPAIVERDIAIRPRFRPALSCNKFLAKIASDMDKPRGFAHPRRQAEARSMPGGQARSASSTGVGPATQEKLSAARLSHHPPTCSAPNDRSR